jgi:hypothetical protein
MPPLFWASIVTAKPGKANALKIAEVSFTTTHL